MAFFERIIMPNFVVLDVETTGIEPQSGRLLSVGAVYCDQGFNAGPTFEVDINCPEFLLESMCDKKIVDMHKKSSLWERCIDSPYSTSQAEQMLLEWLKSHAVSKRTILIGNNINFDKSWLKEFMPEVYKYVHYRSIDVSGVNELVRVFKPELDAQVKSHKRYGHTALADCYESLAELQLYIREVFKG